jgi:hypothetical protein
MCGRLYQAHSRSIRRKVTWLSLRDYIIVWRGFQKTIKRSQCSDNETKEKAREVEENRNLPAEKYPYLFLRFYDTYTYDTYP